MPFVLISGSRGERVNGLKRVGLHGRSLHHFMFAVPRILAAAMAMASIAWPVLANKGRGREPNSVYAERRAKVASNSDGPIVLFAYSGREEESQSYIFAQEENFYYLTGHNEEEAALLILPPAGTAKKDDWQGPREILFLPPKNPLKEKWNGLRMSPSDPGIESRTGFAQVKAMPELRAAVERLAKFYPTFLTVLPYQKEL